MKISTLLVSLSLLLSASSFPDQNNDLRPTLRVCDDVVDTSTLDPRKQFSEKNYTIIHQIFDGLVYSIFE
jgi:ABC-type oligopeptide transport system substrate-binding subunit